MRSIFFKRHQFPYVCNKKGVIVVCDGLSFSTSHFCAFRYSERNRRRSVRRRIYYKSLPLSLSTLPPTKTLLITCYTNHPSSFSGHKSSLALQTESTPPSKRKHRSSPFREKHISTYSHDGCWFSWKTYRQWLALWFHPCHYR